MPKLIFDAETYQDCYDAVSDVNFALVMHTTWLHNFAFRYSGQAESWEETGYPRDAFPALRAPEIGGC